MLKPHFIELNHLKSTIFCGLNPPVKSLNEVRPLAVNLGPGWGEIYGILRKNPGEKMEHLENGENIYGFLMENTLKISIYMSGTYGKIYIFFYADTKMV